MNTFDWSSFRRVPLVAIARGLSADEIQALVPALRDGGFTTLEITMNEPEAAVAQIRLATRIADGALNIGAGTVIDRERLRMAWDAGASFVVTPTVDKRVIAECAARGCPVFPGALSLGEMMLAREHGATCIKLFPAECFGPGYLRRLKEVLPDLGIMPTGGVSLESLAEWKRAGAEALGIGGPLLDRALIAAGDWEGIRRRAAAFVERWNAE